MAYKKLKLWFDQELAETLSEKFQQTSLAFNSKKFLKDLAPALELLELKDRVELLADRIHTATSADYKTVVEEGILKILGPVNPNETGMFTEFYWVMPLAKYVEKYGLADLEASLPALREITKRNTSEFAIRPYIEQHPKIIMEYLQDWTQDPNFHIRRLCSEGIRPRLPWATKLDYFITDPHPIYPILNALKNDKSKYVQKSVANCVNDVLKDNLEVGKSWIDLWKVNPSPQCKWIIKHALRVLRKQNDAWALNVIKSI